MRPRSDTFSEMRHHLVLLGVTLAVVMGCGDDDGDDAVDAGIDAGVDAGPPDLGPTVVVREVEREPCADRNPLRNPYFGDLHIHTRFSFDAAAYDVRTGPDDAYSHELLLCIGTNSTIHDEKRFKLDADELDQSQHSYLVDTFYSNAAMRASRAAITACCS